MSPVKIEWPSLRSWKFQIKFFKKWNLYIKLCNLSIRWIFRHKIKDVLFYEKSYQITNNYKFTSLLKEKSNIIFMIKTIKWIEPS